MSVKNMNRKLIITDALTGIQLITLDSCYISDDIMMKIAHDICDDQLFISDHGLILKWFY